MLASYEEASAAVDAILEDNWKSLAGATWYMVTLPMSNVYPIDPEAVENGPEGNDLSGGSDQESIGGHDDAMKEELDDEVILFVLRA
jgi:hypothetical protein